MPFLFQAVGKFGGIYVLPGMNSPDEFLQVVKFKTSIEQAIFL